MVDDTRNDIRTLTRARFEAVLIQHNTGRDGVWVNCECPHGWMGLQQWASHVTEALVDELTQLAEEMTASGGSS